MIATPTVIDEPVMGGPGDRAGRRVVLDGDLGPQDPVLGPVVATESVHRGLDRGEAVASAPAGLQHGVGGEDVVEFGEGPGIDGRCVTLDQGSQVGGIRRRHRRIVARSSSLRKGSGTDHYTRPVSEAALIEAVQANRVGEVAGASRAAANVAVLHACEMIASRLEATRTEVADILGRAGVDAELAPIDRFPQRYGLEATVPDLETADAAGEALAAAGFEPWETWAGAARRSFERYGDHRSFARTDEVTTVVRVRWRSSSARSTWQRLTHPTPGDWHVVSLPSWAWRLYPVVRLGRLAVERFAPSLRYAGSLGPFLTTPAALLEPLLDLAGVGPDHRVIDLGCGDGRLVAAAAARGATAIGVETDPVLVDRAHRRAAQEGIADQVSFVVGDARTADLTGVDIVFAFLPVEVIAELLPGILERLAPGAIVLIHEQNRLPRWVEPAPDHSDLVVGDGAITVAHRWRVDPESA